MKNNLNFEDLCRILTENVKHWIRINKKLTPLKMLQGFIWKNGYANGKIKSQ